MSVFEVLSTHNVIYCLSFIFFVHRKVREACSMLDLDANIKPCPLEGTQFRPELKKIGGKEQVPLLVVNKSIDHAEN
jgi:hypothetical protein